ncbi:MAG: RagB/SusD family nutrient uptake outer membrane protein [Bacteroidales bacterium]|jgi:hypothetical protein|nr:RagB/SusD family nutrient uptake outer membrane protein [Bacteroidales bacterium]
MKNISNIMNRLPLKGACLAFGLLAFSACDYLDVVPEGTATLDNAFNARIQARRYLTTCYAYLTSHDDGAAVDLTGGDEIWIDSDMDYPTISLDGIKYAEGLQTAVSPLWNYWPHFYMALRDCNIFLENVSKVPDLPEWERDQWIAEVKVLKAYYHFLLLRQYGPVPIVRESLSIDAGVDEVRVKRDPADEVADYAATLISQAIPALPVEVSSPSEEKGRITQAIALTIKALIRTTIASPLFNPTPDVPKLFASLHNHDDATPLISQTYSSEKWALAVAACEEALVACDSLGLELYTWPGDPMYPNMSSTIRRQMTLRNAFCRKWNSEVIWGDTKNTSGNLQIRWGLSLQEGSEWREYAQIRKYGGPTLKVAEQFYSVNGVPIEEDRFYNYAGRYDLRTVVATDDRRLLRSNSVTAGLNFNREPRFYAWLGFDTGVWYGQNNYDDTNPDNLYYVRARFGQDHTISDIAGSLTGYFVKKWIHYQSQHRAKMEYFAEPYGWPHFRLAELYLLYAEALNEAEDSEANRNLAISYLDMVRTRAGLQGVKNAWRTFSTRPNKYETQSGLREIIRQERLIELCFERKRFWDIRRWMTVSDLYQIPVQGWNVMQKDAADYYQPVTIFEQKFNIRDYFWPIPSDEVTGNPNLVQNIGW